ncbi:hypothetical protein [Microbacterium rhizophilus]|uniref:hypothetical protein n=1 Tax=Microbacterium rhizophilus TaxID=3138934 RepID=UPI0031E83729
MSTLDDVMRSVIDEVDGALGCAVVDVTTGELLGVAHDVPYFNQTYLDAVAAAAVQMFRGATVTTVEKLISERRGVTPEHLIEEVQMTTRRTMHFMMILPNHPRAASVLITDRRANVGMSWAAIRRSMLEVEPLLDAAGTAA